MPDTSYVLVGCPRARVDDVLLVQHGEPQPLTDDQVRRLKEAGVQVRKQPARRTSATTHDAAAAADPDPATEA